MAVRHLGHSERGMVNALCDDLAHSPGASVESFLSWFDFPGLRPDFAGVRSATLLVEQSFPDFGDPDLLVLLDHADGRRQAVLVEAKVSNDTRSWLTVEDRWAEFLGMFDGGEWNPSNLFVELHRKVRLVESLSAPGGGFQADPLVSRGSTGRNAVVRRAVEELRRYAGDGSVWFGAILPDAPADIEAFARGTLPTGTVAQRLPGWDSRRWGFLSWRAVDGNTGHGWPRTQATFGWNWGQVFRSEPPIQHAVRAGQVNLLGDAEVYVVQPGHGDGCQVAAVLSSPLIPSAMAWYSSGSNLVKIAAVPDPPLQINSLGASGAVLDSPVRGTTRAWASVILRSTPLGRCSRHPRRRRVGGP